MLIGGTRKASMRVFVLEEYYELTRNLYGLWLLVGPRLRSIIEISLKVAGSRTKTVKLYRAKMF